MRVRGGDGLSAHLSVKEAERSLVTSFQSKETQASVGLGRGRWRKGEGREGLGRMAGLLFKSIKEEEPGAKHPINLTSLAAKISEDIRRKF